MKPTYKIFVLDDKEFDDLDKKLPYMTKEKLGDSLGFANPKTNEAYVRRTQIKEIDEGTLHHELEELLVKVSPDEIDGIRYKKGGVLRTIVPSILGLIPGVGPFLSAASSIGMNQYAQSRHPEQLGKPGFGSALLQGGTAFLGSKLAQSTPGFTAGVNASKAAGGGIIGNTLSGVKGLLLGTPETAGANSSTGLFGTRGSFLGLGTKPSSIPSTAGSTFSALGSPISSSPGGVVGSSPGITPGFVPVPFNPTTYSGAGLSTLPNVGTAPIAPEIGKSSAKSTGVFDKVNTFFKEPKNILGTASIASSLVPKTPEFTLPSSVNDIIAKAQSGTGLSPLGEQARGELSRIISNGPDSAFIDSVLRTTRERYDLAQKELDSAYNRAGAYGSGEHLAEKAKLQEQLARTESQIIADTQYKAIQDAIGADNATMQALLGFTGLSVNEAAAKYNVQAADIEEIRRALGGFGTELLLSNPDKQGG